MIEDMHKVYEFQVFKFTSEKHTVINDPHHEKTFLVSDQVHHKPG